MFIPTVCCVTGSFFHHDGKRSERQFQKNRGIVGGVFGGDCGGAIVIIVMGILAFTTTAHGFHTFTLSARITMITGGTVLIIADTVYLVYRCRCSKDELQGNSATLKRIYAEHLRVLKEQEAEISALIHDNDQEIERLEHKIVPDIQKILEDQNNCILEIQELEKDGINVHTLREEALSGKSRMENSLREAMENLECLKACLHENLEIKEDIERQQALVT